jgi:hypothetical protein
MSDTTVVAVSPDQSHSYVQWGPVFGGALVASALSTILFAFGSSAGIASVSPYSWNNPSPTTLSIIGAVWFVIVMIGSFLVGGYFAGRFRRPVEIATLDEVETRDGGHGLLVWALGLVIGIVIASMAATGAAKTVAGAAGLAGGVAAQNTSADSVARLSDVMLRPAQPDPNADPRAEIGRVLSGSVSRGEVSDDDRAYLAKVVSAKAGIPEDEARKRVDSAIEQAKAAADKARKAAAILAFLIGAASLFSAGAAYWGATMGGQHRNESLRA